jgi:hypothetical protein
VPDIRPPVEECHAWITEHGQPHFIPHAKNCSRFWECESSGSVCLFECAPCGPIDPDSCPEGSLFFDHHIDYPDGPVCNWATGIDCDGGVRPDVSTMVPTGHISTWTPIPSNPTQKPTTKPPTQPPTQKPTTQKPTQQPTTKPPTQPPTQQPTTPGDCPGCVCEPGDDGWYKPYPGNCHKYYECTQTSNGWEITIFDCGAWVFDPHQAACTWPELMPDCQ